MNIIKLKPKSAKDPIQTFAYSKPFADPNKRKKREQTKVSREYIVQDCGVTDKRWQGSNLQQWKTGQRKMSD